MIQPRPFCDALKGEAMPFAERPWISDEGAAAERSTGRWGPTRRSLMTDRRRDGSLQMPNINRTAEALGVSPSTIRREIKDRALKATRIRGQVRIHLDDLDDYLKRSGKTDRF